MQLKSRKLSLTLFLLLSIVLLVVGLTVNTVMSTSPPADQENIAIKISQMLLLNIKTSNYLGPPASARALSMVTAGMYDTWSKFSVRATAWIATNIPKVSVMERTPHNINKAIAFAGYCVMNNIFNTPAQLAANKKFMIALGYDPNSTAPFPTLGRQVCEQMISRFMWDNMNQNGREPSSPPNHPPYNGNFTNFYPVNNPQNAPLVTDCQRLRSLNHWEPLMIGSAIQQFVSPQMGTVDPFSINVVQMRNLIPCPPRAGSNTNQLFINQHTEILDISGRLDDRMKIIAEYWEGGPGTVSPAGLWYDIAIQAAKAKRLDLEASVKLLFLQAQAVLDAAISSWDIKRFYESPRPITTIRCLYNGHPVTAWRGYYQGVGQIADAITWLPYQRPTFITPSFPEYISGHSTFSFASAEVLKTFLKSDQFFGTHTVKAGESEIEPRIDNPSDPRFVPGVTNVPNSGYNTVGYSPAHDVQLTWHTFTERAEQASISRLYGGIHIRMSSEGGHIVGRAVGQSVLQKAFQLFGQDLHSWR